MVIVFVLLLLICIVSLSGSLEYLSTADWVPYDIRARVKELNDFIMSGEAEAGTDMASRFELYLCSLRAFWENAMIGSCILGKGSIGGHSELLDMFAMYGIIYSILFLTVFVQLIRDIKRLLLSDTFRIYIVITVLLIFQSIINTSTWSSIMLVYILIIPLMLKYYSEPSEKTTIMRGKGI